MDECSSDPITEVFSDFLSRDLVVSRSGILNNIKGYLAELLVLWSLGDILYSKGVKYSMIWHGVIEFRSSNYYNSVFDYEHYIKTIYVEHIPSPTPYHRVFYPYSDKIRLYPFYKISPPSAVTFFYTLNEEEKVLNRLRFLETRIRCQKNSI